MLSTVFRNISMCTGTNFTNYRRLEKEGAGEWGVNIGTDGVLYTLYDILILVIAGAIFGEDTIIQKKFAWKHSYR